MRVLSLILVLLVVGTVHGQSEVQVKAQKWSLAEYQQIIQRKLFSLSVFAGINESAEKDKLKKMKKEESTPEKIAAAELFYKENYEKVLTSMVDDLDAGFSEMISDYSGDSKDQLEKIQKTVIAAMASFRGNKKKDQIMKATMKEVSASLMKVTPANP